MRRTSKISNRNKKTISFLRGANAKQIFISRGLVFGGLSTTISIVIRSLNFDVSYPYIETIAHVFFLFIFILTAVQWYRYIGGWLNGRSVLTIGIGIALVSSGVNAFYQILYLEIFRPDYAEGFREVKYNILIEEGMTYEECSAILDSIWRTKIFSSSILSIIRITLTTVLASIGLSYASIPITHLIDPKVAESKRRRKMSKRAVVVRGPRPKQTSPKKGKVTRKP